MASPGTIVFVQLPHWSQPAMSPVLTNNAYPLSNLLMDYRTAIPTTVVQYSLGDQSSRLPSPLLCPLLIGLPYILP